MPRSHSHFVTDGITGPNPSSLSPSTSCAESAPWLGCFGEPDFWGSFLSCTSAFIHHEIKLRKACSRIRDVKNRGLTMVKPAWSVASLLWSKPSQNWQSHLAAPHWSRDIWTVNASCMPLRFCGCLSYSTFVATDNEDFQTLSDNWVAYFLLKIFPNYNNHYLIFVSVFTMANWILDKLTIFYWSATAPENQGLTSLGSRSESYLKEKKSNVRTEVEKNRKLSKESNE